MKPSHANPGTAEKLGAVLERHRLTRRARRVTAVIAALRQQAGGPRAEPHARNRQIHQAITEFEAEVAAINTRPSDLPAGATPARSRRDPPRDWTTPLSVSFQVYDGFDMPGYSLIDYADKWFLPYGLGEMAVNDDRNFSQGIPEPGRGPVPDGV
jgi:hypothetical protein